MSNRLQIVPISHEFLRSMLAGKFPDAECVADPLPEDAILVAVNSDGRTVYLTYHSEAFDPVDGGSPIPQLGPVYRTEHRGA